MSQTVSVVDDIKAVLQMKGLRYKPDGTGNNLVVETCPLCGDERGKLEIGIAFNNLGLWNCFICEGQSLGPGKKNWDKLKKAIVGEEGLIAMPLPFKEAKAINDRFEHVKLWHKALKQDKETIQWLLDRKLYVDLMDEYLIGVTPYKHPDTGQDCKALVIPHVFKNNLMNIKFRMLPPSPKRFTRVPGASSILYNYDKIDLSKDYIYVCEGELDTLSLVQAGERNVVGITVGAKRFDPSWIELLKDFKIVYIVLDNDPPGQEGARIIADRLGRDRCLNVLLPPDPINDQGDTISDVNDYFRIFDIDEFRSLTLKATKFTIDTIFSMEGVFEELEHKLKTTGRIIDGLETPWSSLNTKMGVMAPGDLIYVSGKPKTGKTSLALQICYDLSYNHDVPTLLFCLEMPPQRILTKLISLHRRLQMTTPMPTHDDLVMTRNDFEDKLMQFYVGYATNSNLLKIDKLTSIFKQAKRKYGLGLIVFDNIQYLCRSITNVAQETAKVSRDFKLLAMELGIPVMVIAQPRKLANDQIMTSTDMKDSAAMEADADTVLINHRKSFADKKVKSGEVEDDTLLSPVITVTIDRTRYAIGGFVSLYLDGEHSHFREATKDDLVALE